MITYKGKQITIKDFTPTISWEQIEITLGKRNYKKFCKFMEGQTCSENGVYPCDLENFLDGRPCND